MTALSQSKSRAALVYGFAIFRAHASEKNRSSTRRHGERKGPQSLSDAALFADIAQLSLQSILDLEEGCLEKREGDVIQRRRFHRECFIGSTNAFLPGGGLQAQ